MSWSFRNVKQSWLLKSFGSPLIQSYLKEILILLKSNKQRRPTTQSPCYCGPRSSCPSCVHCGNPDTQLLSTTACPTWWWKMSNIVKTVSTYWFPACPKSPWPTCSDNKDFTKLFLAGPLPSSKSTSQPPLAAHNTVASCYNIFNWKEIQTIHVLIISHLGYHLLYSSQINAFYFSIKLADMPSIWTVCGVLDIYIK